ncbi:MAG: hypothetical protein LBR74_09425 [Eubacterium sp.]|jgi:hypothetical protein|nr:hypothetical protein [Eubacterium sp.]
MNFVITTKFAGDDLFDLFDGEVPGYVYNFGEYFKKILGEYLTLTEIYKKRFDSIINESEGNKSFSSIMIDTQTSLDLEDMFNNALSEKEFCENNINNFRLIHEKNDSATDSDDRGEFDDITESFENLSSAIKIRNETLYELAEKNYELVNVNLNGEKTGQIILGGELFLNSYEEYGSVLLKGIFDQNKETNEEHSIINEKKDLNDFLKYDILKEGLYAIRMVQDLYNIEETLSRTPILNELKWDKYNLVEELYAQKGLSFSSEQVDMPISYDDVFPEYQAVGRIEKNFDRNKMKARYGDIWELIGAYTSISQLFKENHKTEEFLHYSAENRERSTFAARHDLTSDTFKSIVDINENKSKTIDSMALSAKEISTPVVNNIYNNQKIELNPTVYNNAKEDIQQLFEQWATELFENFKTDGERAYI